MITTAEEDYLKQTYNLQVEHGQVTTTMLAERVGHAPPSVTAMLKKLARRGWVTYEPYRGVTLTDTGRTIALEVLRHHRLLETYLAQALGIPWDRVHEEAEKLEHVLSEYLESRIDEYLGHPRTDPHGHSIPALDGSVRAPARHRLSEAAAGQQLEVVEVWDKDPQVLARLRETGIGPGALVDVIAADPIDGLVTIRVGARTCVLGTVTAAAVMVRKHRKG